MCLKQPKLVPLIANVPFLLTPVDPRQSTPDLWIRIVQKVYNLSIYFSTWPPFGRDFLWRNEGSSNRDLPHRVVAQDSTFCVLSAQNPKEEQLFFLKPSLRAHAGFPQIQVSLLRRFSFQTHVLRVYKILQYMDGLKWNPPKNYWNPAGAPTTPPNIGLKEWGQYDENTFFLANYVSLFFFCTACSQPSRGQGNKADCQHRSTSGLDNVEETLVGSLVPPIRQLGDHNHYRNPNGPTQSQVKIFLMK